MSQENYLFLALMVHTHTETSTLAHIIISPAKIRANDSGTMIVSDLWTKLKSLLIMVGATKDTNKKIRKHQKYLENIYSYFLYGFHVENGAIILSIIRFRIFSTYKSWLFYIHYIYNYTSLLFSPHNFWAYYFYCYYSCVYSNESRVNVTFVTLNLV